MVETGPTPPRRWRRLDHSATLPRQPAFEHVPIGGIVVDDKDPARLHGLAFASPRPSGNGAPPPAGNTSGYDLKLLAATVVTVLLRLAGWRASVHHGVDLVKKLARRNP